MNTYERFGVPAFTPVLLNISMIGCALLVGPLLNEPAFALAIGVTVGGLLQLGFQLPFIARLGLLAWPRFRRGHEGVKRIVRLMLPAVFGASVSQLNLLINTLLASFLVTGNIPGLLSDRLLEFPPKPGQCRTVIPALVIAACVGQPRGVYSHARLVTATRVADRCARGGRTFLAGCTTVDDALPLR